MPRAISDATLLAHIRKLPHGRATYKQLVKEFRATGEDRNTLDSVLDRLSALGDLVELRSGHFISTAENPEYVAGKVSVHRDGYGFVIPDAAIAELHGDVFLPPDEARKTMHGDRVLAHITRLDHDRRAEGEIVRILKRAHLTVVGEFRVKKR